MIEITTSSSTKVRPWVLARRMIRTSWSILLCPFRDACLLGHGSHALLRCRFTGPIHGRPAEHEFRRSYILAWDRSTKQAHNTFHSVNLCRNSANKGLDGQNSTLPPASALQAPYVFWCTPHA